MNATTNAARVAVEAAALPGAVQSLSKKGVFSSCAASNSSNKSTENVLQHAAQAIKTDTPATALAGQPRDVFNCIAAGIPREQWEAALNHEEARAWSAWLAEADAQNGSERQLQAVIMRSADASKLVYQAKDTADHLRRTMEAYDGLEYMVSCAAESAMAQPEQLGSILRSINECINIRLDKLEAELSELQQVLSTSQPALWRA
ncbi:hypothetical protein [Comamonas koreensis]|uniref:Uncharacterized protein n=1 Tax=Comamonas koreensis TaxID=160825 RepID=A0AAW4XQZ3_9BURK|nr:hypothetical protein [Comamonas koreensis]MCD2163826.1 hypothetical protein [Comamonas koreensis]